MGSVMRRLLHRHALSASRPTRGCSVQSRYCASRGEDRERVHYETGEVCHGFEVFQKFEVKERDWTCYRLRHQETQAEYFHVDCSDTENTFGVVFNTHPDSSGVAHILEHTVLCGSRRFPVRDPFFNMLKRSINTYMNAWTGYDWTGYPFSSQNPKDFQNLLEVYLDSVFFPNISYLDFRQEGHRFELSDPNNIKSPLAIKGVVYNEMKGANASPDRQIITKLHSELFPPEVTYHYDSGGDPAKICHLTHDQLKQFHADNYHPSNSRFYSYGDLPLARTLQYLNENILSQFSAGSRTPPVPKVQRASAIRDLDAFYVPYPGVPLESGHTALFSVLTNDMHDVQETFNMELLSSLLLKGSSSPFYKARMVSGGIGKDFSIGTGYDDSTRETTFGFGLQGVTQEEIKQAFDLFENTLVQTADKGFSQERIDSVLHSMEISKKNVPNNLGLSLFGSVTSVWTNGVDLEKYLDSDGLIQHFRENHAADPTYLQKKIQTHLLDNKHGVRIAFHPDPEYTQKNQEKESSFLEKASKEMSLEMREKIHHVQTQELEAYQAREENRDCLPKMEISDIARDVLTTELQDKPMRNYPVQWCAQPTNELSFVRGLANVDSLPNELASYLPLYSSIFANMGTSQYSYGDLSQRIQNYTGGVSADWSVHHHYGKSALEWGFRFSAFALERNIEEMFHILRDVYTLPMQDKDQLKSLLQNLAGRLEDRLVSSGHVFAMSYSARNINEQQYYSEQLSGITFLKFLQQIQRDAPYEEIMQKMNAIQEHLRNTASLRFAVNTESRLFDQVEAGLGSFVEPLSAETATSSSVSREPQMNASPDAVFVPLQSEVNYCAMSLPGVNYVHEDYPKLQVLATLLSTNYLHPAIRESGGAYGAGLRAGETLSFYSYRDPNMEETLDTYRGSYDWLRKEGRISDSDMEEAKLSLFGTMDTPTVPSRKGLSRFRQGITDEMRQKLRDTVFATNRDDLMEMAEKYLSPEQIANASVAVLGNMEKPTPEGWTVHQLVN